MSIVLDSLTKRYERQAVVNRVALDVADGEFFVLLGPSGSGKSTILRMIAGLAEVDAGRVILHGRDVTALPPQGRDVGFVFQHYALFQHMTVGDNVEFALRIRNVPSAQRQRRRDELLELVGLAGLAKRYPRQLSGGQQQRVALARALAHKPAVLLLDEPFGALDAKIRIDLRRNLRTIQREFNITTIFVTHDQEEAFELADRMGVMNQGRLLEVGTPVELYQRPQTEFVATFLGSANVLMGQCTLQGVQVGPMEFPLSTISDQDNGSPQVQVLFRPEDVALAAYEDGLRCPTLGSGTVETSVVVGAFERLRLRLPALEGVRAVAPVRSFGDNDILIDVMRAPDDVRRFPLRPGDATWVGVRRIHALAQPGLSLLLPSDRGAAAEGAVDLGAQLARLSHARSTLVAYGGSDDELRQYIHLARERIGGGLPGLQTRSSPDGLGATLQREIEHDPCDLVVLGVDQRNAAHIAADALAAGKHNVLLVPRGQTGITHALICVADGEPGKEDVLFAGRLLRHLGANATVMSMLWPEDHDPAYRTRVDQFLTAGVRTLQQLDVPAKSLLQTGDVFQGIQAELAEGGYDLLVVGAPLPRSDGRVVISGVVEQLLAAGLAVPLLIVRSTYVQSVRRHQPLSVVEEVV